MTKKEIHEKIENLKNEFSKEIKSLEKKLEEMEEKNKVFNPYPIEIEGDYFYTIDEHGSIKKNINYSISSNHVYNAFNSEEYAELRLKEIYLQDRMWEFSYQNGWKDKYLYDENMQKYFLFMTSQENELCSRYRYSNIPSIVFFSSEEAVRKAKKEFGTEIKELHKMRAEIAEGRD